MESSNNDNVVSLAEFRQKKMEPKMKRTRHLESFVEGYHEAGPEATDVFNKTMMLLRAYGFETEDFDRKDVLLLREAIFSIILRYREQHHPLHMFVEDFDKYFNKLEYFLDSEWHNADEDDHDDPDDEGPNQT
jgi:hypothetical protein